MALFGCAPKRPLDYSGSAGLLWAINGGRLIELHRDWTVIDVPVNRSQRVFYRRNVDQAKIAFLVSSGGSILHVARHPAQRIERWPSIAALSATDAVILVDLRHLPG